MYSRPLFPTTNLKTEILFMVLGKKYVGSQKKIISNVVWKPSVKTGTELQDVNRKIRKMFLTVTYWEIKN